MNDGGFLADDETELYAGHTIRLVHARFRTPGGAEFTRDIVRHPGAVSVVALDDDGTVVMERQFRAALGRDLLEIPAGKLDVPGEDPLDAAARELAEEVGLAAERWTLLGEFYNSPGFCDERSFTYLAQGLSEVPSSAQGHEEEAMTVERIRLADVPALIADGTLHDAKSMIGLLLAMRHVGL